MCCNCCDYRVCLCRYVSLSSVMQVNVRPFKYLIENTLNDTLQLPFVLMHLFKNDKNVLISLEPKDKSIK